MMATLNKAAKSSWVFRTSGGRGGGSSTNEGSPLPGLGANSGCGCRSDPELAISAGDLADLLNFTEYLKV
jgi:hypothetical protein